MGSVTIPFVMSFVSLPVLMRTDPFSYSHVFCSCHVTICAQNRTSHIDDTKDTNTPGFAEVGFVRLN